MSLNLKIRTEEFNISTFVMADPVVYLLVNFPQNDELAIGTLEAIAVPKDFRGESFLHQFDQLRLSVGTKRVIGIK